MGRRKIEMEYIADDRVRKVTFCKRKGGLFKKADDLAKLCGVEIAVLIVGDNKSQHHCTSEVNHVISNYQTLQSGQAVSEEDELSKLIKRGEEQRREIERLNRELAEKNKLMGGGAPPAATIAPMIMPGVVGMIPGMPLGLPAGLMAPQFTPVEATEAKPEDNAVVEESPPAKRAKVDTELPPSSTTIAEVN